MLDKSQIQEHAEVVSSDGKPIGKVDHVEGDFLKLTRDSSPDGQHKYLPLSALLDSQGGRLSTIMNHDAATSLLQDSAEPGETVVAATSS